VITKICTVCGEDKSLTDYYTHPFGMAGRMSKCKECHKSYVRTWYANTRPARSAYEQKRARRPERKTHVARCQQARKVNSPIKVKAWNAVSNAIRDKKLKRLPCEVCGNEKSQAHHDDYSNPLDVHWLCFKHHREDAHGQTTIEVRPQESAQLSIDLSCLSAQETKVAA